jgi:tetratricopeptide (TPR) repeat protein
MRKLLAAILVTVLLPHSLSAATTAAEYAAAGKTALDRDEYQKAADLYQKAIALEPKNAEHHFWLGAAHGEAAQAGNVFSQASNGKRAKAALEKAVELDPRHIEARLALLTFYLFAPGFMGGGEDKAMAQAAEIRKIDAIDGHRAYSRIYARQKKTDLVRKEYVDAVREQPNSARAHYFLGNFHLREKNYPAALHEYEMALKLDPQFMPTYVSLGQHAANSGTNFERGEEALRKYLTYKPTSREPGHAAAWYSIGVIQEKQGKKAEARASFNNALKLAPTDKNVIEALKRVS